MDNVNIRQLYDDLSYFYPITCVDAVVGGSMSAGSVPTVVDLSSYISGNFSGIFKLYIYDNTLKHFVLDISRNRGFTVTIGTNRILASGVIPVAYYPEVPLVFKTITDDDTCKANVILDTDGKLSLHVIPRTETSTNSDGTVVANAILDVTKIKANAIDIIEQK